VLSVTLECQASGNSLKQPVSVIHWPKSEIGKVQDVIKSDTSRQI